MLQLRERAVEVGVAPSRPRLWRRAVFVCSAPALVLLVLGLVQVLRDRPLWYDESYSRLAAGVPLGTLVSGMWHRVGVVFYLMDVPPSFNGPYYVLLHFWVLAFGDSAVSLRMASLLAAVAAVAVLAELARRLAGPGAGLLCGLLLATGPLYVDEVTQARDYGLALLSISLCALWLHDWLSSDRHLGRAVAAGAVAGLVHWFTLPVLAGLAVVALVERRGPPGRRAAAALAGAAVPAGVLVGWSMLGGTYGAPTPVPVGLSLPVQAVRDWSGGLRVLALGLALAAALGVWRSRHRVLLLGWVVVPLLMVTALEVVRPSYFPRYVLFSLVGLALAASLGVAALRSARMRLAVGSALVVLSLAGTVPLLDDGAREPVPAVVRLLAAEQTAGEPVVPADGRTSLDLETYLDLAPRLADDLVLPPELFTDQTTSSTVWLVRIVLKENSLPVVPAEQRLLDAGWTQVTSTLLTGTTTDMRIERWTK